MLFPLSSDTDEDIANDSDAIEKTTAKLDTRRVATKTPLYCAVYHKGGDSAKIVKFLLDNGATVYEEYRVPFAKKATLWQAACKVGWPGTKEVLKEYLLSKNLWPPNPAY